MSDQTLTSVALSALKPHPKNSEYFDDVSGQDYENLRDSIKLDGIQAPIIVAADMTIISGHQRCRVAKELDLPQVPVIIRSDIESEDDKLRNLIAANFGRLKNNEKKQRKAVAKYVELVGSPHGGDRKSRDQNGLLNERLTLDQIAEQLDISKTELKRILSIERNLTDSMKELLDSGVIGKTLAADCIASMTPEEQEELVSTLDAAKKYTARELQPYIDKIRNLEAEISNKEETVTQSLSQEIENLQDALSQARDDAGWYKDQYEEAKAKLEAVDAPKYQSSKEYSGVTANTTYFSHLLFKVQEMLDNDLSPIKFSQAIDGIQERKVDRRNLTLLLEKVKSWCKDIEQITGSEEIIESCAENEAIIMY